jgi:hypothetical protein
MASENTHTCGWTHSQADKYCRGCGERIFKAVREYSEIMAEIEALKNMAMEKPYPRFYGCFLDDQQYSSMGGRRKPSSSIRAA